MSETLIKTEYHVYASDMCKTHDTEHIVSGHTVDKKLVGSLKNDLVKILREDWPECKLQPKPKQSAIERAYRSDTPVKRPNGVQKYPVRWECERL